MAKKKAKNILAGVAMVFAPLAIISITVGQIMEKYQPSLDTYFNTLSYKTVSESSSDQDWIFESKFTSGKTAFNSLKEFALKEAEEGNVLLKNKENALPLAKTERKVTLLGLRSWATVYGNSGASIADTKTTLNGNRTHDCFTNNGFEVNPDTIAVYQEYTKDMTWAKANPMSGLSAPEYSELAVTNDIPELSPSEMKDIKSDYDAKFSSYNTAIVMVGRPGAEADTYFPGKDGMVSTCSTETDNIFGISSEEREIIELAKEKFDKVVVLVNAVTPMELRSLQDDDGIDAVMWIGYPGPYGMNQVAKTLAGEINPSGHLGDTYATNTNAAPAMKNFGNSTKWSGDFAAEAQVNSYLIEAEGIYTGYRYYETRYADIVAGVDGAKTAAAGTYTGTDYKLAASAGEWSYDWEVTYPFGYGLSYTTFEQKLDSVTIQGDKKTAVAKVTVTNTGKVAGKDVVELYGQSPYTTYDKTNGVEKSAIQLLDYEKTGIIEAGHSETVTLNIDMSLLASYDYTKAKTYIVDGGTYYISIGSDSHDALNNVLKAQGYNVEGNANNTYSWEWEFDDKTFSVSDTGTEITNQISSGDYSMDFNSFVPGTVTYLSRSNWNGTYPKTYSGLTGHETDRLAKLLGCDWYELHTNDDTSSYKWGVDNGMKLYEMKMADWDDERWDDIVDQVTIDGYLYYAEMAFHTVRSIEEVGFAGAGCDDGPGGSDSHYLDEGSYHGQAWSDAKDYAGYGTRVAPGQINLAYTWNKELAYENGQIILGETSLSLGLPVLIGPGTNIHRHAYNGRGGEYFSEDPVLSGYTTSAVVQGAQSKGCLVNIKHAAFNDQEIDRAGVAVFTNEQAGRELELRNLQQSIVGKGQPSSFVGNEEYANAYTEGALGIMTSYNRIGAVPSCANEGVMKNIMQKEWGFHGFSVTDFSSVCLKTSPKEALLCGTNAFCGFGVQDESTKAYWSGEVLSKDANMCAALKYDIKATLWSLANSNAMNGYNNSTHRVWLMSSWRKLYISMISVSAGIAGLSLIGWGVLEVLARAKKED